MNQTSYFFRVKLNEDLLSHSECNCLEHEEFWEAVFWNLGYEETTPNSCSRILGVLTYCTILDFLLDSHQLHFSSSPNVLCWDTGPARHRPRAHNDFSVRTLWCKSLYNANEICYLASHLLILGSSLASHSPACPLSICTVCVYLLNSARTGQLDILTI